MVGRRVGEIFQGDSTADLIARYGRVTQSGEPDQFETYFPDLDKYFEISAFNLEGGQFGVMFADISSRKLAEQRQAEQETHFRGLFEQAGQPMAIVSLDGAITLTNPFFCNLVGYPPESILGMTIADLTAPEDFGQEADHLQALRSGLAESFILQKRYRRRDGQLVWGLQSVARVSTNTLGEDYFIYQVQDISEQKNLEARLRYRSEFQAIISDISTAFLKLSIAEFPYAIELALQWLVEFTGVAGGYIFRLAENLETYWLDYLWERNGARLAPLRGEIRLVEKFAWGVNLLLCGEALVVNDLDRVPHDLQDFSAGMRGLELGAFIVVPLKVGENVIGFAGLYADTRTASLEPG